MAAENASLLIVMHQAIPYKLIKETHAPISELAFDPGALLQRHGSNRVVGWLVGWLVGIIPASLAARRIL
jgi:hypothetical protein